MKFLLFLILSIGLIITLGSVYEHANAACSRNQDWPDAPCYGAPGLYPTVERDKDSWTGYYDYKGQEWMEQKKQEMLGALRDGNLCNWAASGPPDQNYNLLTYYFVNRVISSYNCAIATEYQYAGVNTLPDDIAHGEIVTAKTNGNSFNYGQTIQLTIEDYNNGPKRFTTAIDKYPAIPSPCGIDYLDFVFLDGDHTDISSFDEILAAKNYSLNVVYGMPYSAASCPLGYFKSVKDATIQENSHEATITYVTANGPMETKADLITVYQIDHVYDKESTRKKIAPNQELEYVPSQILPVGKYTIVAFSMSGKISKPLLLEVTNQTRINVSYLDLRNAASEFSYSCDGPGLTSKEACESQHLVFIGVIGGIISAIIATFMILFRRKK
jgi:hypothetical protein